MARPYRGPVTVKELILLPAVFTFFVTIVRLIGELLHGPEILFGSEAGGGGSIIGISWLIPIFGIYFAVKQVQNGVGPSSWTRAFLWFPLAIVILIGGGAGITAIYGEGLSTAALLLFAVLSWVAIAVASRGWSFLFTPLLVYAFAARIPVAIVMLPAILGNWGTHYDRVPPNFPPMNPFLKWILVGVIPQFSIWIAITVLGGGLLGGIVGGIMQLTKKKPQP